MYGTSLFIFGISLMVVAAGLFAASWFYARNLKKAWYERQLKTYGRMCVEEGKRLSERLQAERTVRVSRKEAVS